MPSVIFTPRSIANLEMLRDFLAQKSLSATMQFQKAFRKEIELLESSPKIGRPVTGSSYRELVIAFGDSGYVVRYRETDNAIVIVAVKHQRQKRFFRG